ncbi:MAG TPA: BON domain-containing protein [Vicinamibacteria bacterium]|nr:BON domain-containing protein [Vicinamibacteria bacterium]
MQELRGRVLALVGLLAALLATPAFASSDADLQRKIERRLAKAGFQQKADVRVDVEAGVARLSGITLRYLDLREAERLARKDARSVVNLLRVVPEEPRSDKAIKTDAERAVLRWERYGPYDAVGIEVTDGVVQLTGWVETEYKRDEIENRLARVDAVRDIHNDLHLQGFSQGDVRLRQQIHARIYRDPLFERYAGLADPPVRVFVDRGRVTLAGTVGSQVEQVAVGLIARGTLAFSVDNEVQVEGDKARKEDRKKEPNEG